MVPVHVGGLFLYPDDMLHADVNGVSTIPKEIAADVADVGAEFVEPRRWWSSTPCAPPTPPSRR
ncbi:MAG: hypothetical protein R2838_18780 [Caldilineaceae bacterium]